MDLVELVILVFIPINTAFLITAYYIAYLKGIKKQPQKVKPNKVWILAALISAIPFAVYKILLMVSHEIHVYCDHEMIPRMLDGDHALYLLFTLFANAGSIVTLCVLKASNKEE